MRAERKSHIATTVSVMDAHRAIAQAETLACTKADCVLINRSSMDDLRAELARPRSAPTLPLDQGFTQLWGLPIYFCEGVPPGSLWVIMPQPRPALPPDPIVIEVRRPSLLKRVRRSLRRHG